MPGVAHPITQRGTDRQQVFFDDPDRQVYVSLLAANARRHGVAILGYCLMSNHVHLVAIPEGEDSLAKALGRTHGRSPRVCLSPGVPAGVARLAARSTIVAGTTGAAHWLEGTAGYLVR